MPKAKKKGGKPRASRSFAGFDFTGFWDDHEDSIEEYTSPPPTKTLIASVEKELGYKLPEAYIALMQLHNGGVPNRSCFPTKGRTSWADDHVALSGIFGIGRDKEYSLCGAMGSKFMMDEWGYPDLGVYFADCPSAGHDMIALDYRKVGPNGEPSVVHVDQERDYHVTPLAPNFEAFIRGLVSDEEFEE